jgi:type I restriction enzyme M protein
MNRDKKRERKAKVLFIEASREFKLGTTQNYLRDEDIQKISATFRAWKNVPKYAQVVDLAEIEKNDFNLNISRYVETAEAAERIDVAEAIAALREAERKRAEAERRMDGHLVELGYVEK